MMQLEIWELSCHSKCGGLVTLTLGTDVGLVALHELVIVSLCLSGRCKCCICDSLSVSNGVSPGVIKAKFVSPQEIGILHFCLQEGTLN